MERTSFDKPVEQNRDCVANERLVSGEMALSDSFHDTADSSTDHKADSLDTGNKQVEQLDKIKQVPKEVGVMLITAGIVGFILPGPGTPAIIAGGLALWPDAFGKIESWLVRRNPGLYRKGVRQINRFLDDLEKRYPDSTNL